MPAKASKPASPVKPPAPEKTPAVKEEKKIEKPLPTPVEKPAVLPVKPVEKPVGLPKPVAQPAAKLAKDLGAEKFLAKCLITLKDVASQEDVTKAVNESWAKINVWKLQSAIAYVKAKFATGMGNPEGSLIVGHGDAVKDKTVIGATVYLLKEKGFMNLKLVGKSTLEYEHLTAGRVVSKLNAPKYEIEPSSVVSIPISDMDFYNALLNASIPKTEVPTHSYQAYEVVCMECKVRGFGADFTNPSATKNNSLRFTLSPLAITEWDITGWVQTRQFGGAYLAMLGEGELAEYSRMEIKEKAAFLDSILRDQIVMACLKVSKDVFKKYVSNEQEYTNLDGEIITLALRPDELDPVVYESRPTRMAKPATSAVDNAISGQSIGTTTDIPSEQPVGDAPSVLPPEVLQRIAEIKAITGKEDAIIQQDAIDIQAANADLEQLTLLQALNMLHDNEKEKAKNAGGLAAPEKVADYTNPEDDTPALKELRTAAMRAKWQGFTHEEFLAWAAKYNRKNVNAETLPKDVFQAFIAANKPGGK